MIWFFCDVGDDAVLKFDLSNSVSRYINRVRGHNLVLELTIENFEVIYVSVNFYSWNSIKLIFAEYAVIHDEYRIFSQSNSENGLFIVMVSYQLMHFKMLDQSRMRILKQDERVSQWLWIFDDQVCHSDLIPGVDRDEICFSGDSVDR